MAAKTQIAVTKQAAGTGQALDRVKLFWADRSPQQRIYLGLGLALTLGVAAFFVKMMSTPEYKPLMSGLESADAQAIAAQLAAKKIPYLVSPDGTSITVPADQVDAARLEVASHDSPHSGRIGFEIFDKVSWGQTEFDEKVNYQRALEGELERTIQTMSNVKSARVHLVMATDSVFMDRERGAKASVTLRLRGGSLSRAEISEISRLVAGAVDELKPADVVIIDADSNKSVGLGGGPTDPGEGIEQELTRRLISTLAPVLGTDRMRASVNVEYETGSSEESQEKYDPAVSVTLNMQRSEDFTGPGAGVGGVPGTSSNVAAAKPVPPPAAGASATVPPPTIAKEPSQTSKTESATYGVNRTTRHVIEPAGSIRRVTAAVLLDDAVERKQEKGKWIEIHRKRNPEELKTISELAQAAIGFNSARGDVISVQNLSFDHPAAEEIPPVTFVDKARKGMNDYSSIIRYAGLLVLFLLVYMLMLRPIQQRALAAPNPQLAASRALVAGDAEAVAVGETAANLALRSQVLRKQLAEFVKAEPESSTNAVRAWLREEAQ
ncbi:MAG: flagellar basal-body MS-ring/collar protein FliF [Acidobacteriaceae bacterium]|jgi:flagellar M-ring protein FliF